ncbi:MAG: methyltransferase domain-containing protein [Phycisphaera sp.]|nr:MAG: methyltransferase domain-containing protein [Phycisphaera sp.]
MLREAIAVVVGLAATCAQAQYDWSPEALAAEAARVEEVVGNEAVLEWLGKAKELPEVKGATLFVGPREPGGFDREVYTAQQATDFSESDLIDFREVTYGPTRYYATNYGSPIAYAPALIAAAEAGGFDSFRFKRVLDFGYGQIGQLEMLARCGATVCGVEADPVIDTLYRSTRLSDVVVAEDGTRGSLTLALGEWFSDWRLRQKLGGRFDVIIARNVLKRGYVQPEEPMPGFDPIDIGGEPEDAARAIYNALEEGGVAVVYNLGGGAWRGEDGSYNAPADVRDPLGREAWEAAGFEIVHYQANGSQLMRKVASLISQKDLSEFDLYNVLYTVVRKPE